jgi:hypothetical protein
MLLLFFSLLLFGLSVSHYIPGESKAVTVEEDSFMERTTGEERRGRVRVQERK